ncbi:hypothetical protein HYH02_009669 [Chlamydomonas schloesseri]|uniref:BTB domain-containing protein n=1 Tax=Chlamydomonas schloesseri TaxID=2026947 RepID=A0A835W9S3_9CHLO|nr:hypothetical protein HYH02_009669 [Chlamydomonas schloesseri]|eukprot:KAG2442181.1 hypothetical protein HYH02_009669 [Chlamydomonas schloesseri]
MAASAIDKQPTGCITLLTADGYELLVDKEMLCSSSKFFAGMLTACDTTRLHVEESRDCMEPVLAAMRGSPPAATYDTRSTSCWAVYKKVLVVADKYDMSLVRERVEKWLVSRCLRGRMRSTGFKFQDVAEGFEWLAICQKFDLKDLGWYCAYDLGTQLAGGAWGHRPVHEALEGVSCPELLKTVLEAVQAAVLAGAGAGAAGGAPGDVPEAGPAHDA